MKGPSIPPMLAMLLMRATPIAAAGPLRNVAGRAEMIPAEMTLQSQVNGTSTAAQQESRSFSKSTQAKMQKNVCLETMPLKGKSEHS